MYNLSEVLEGIKYIHIRAIFASRFRTLEINASGHFNYFAKTATLSIERQRERVLGFGTQLGNVYASKLTSTKYTHRHTWSMLKDTGVKVHLMLVYITFWSKFLISSKSKDNPFDSLSMILNDAREKHANILYKDRLNLILGLF